MGRHRRSQRTRLYSADHAPPSPGTCLGLQYDSGNTVRTSVGVGLIWASPFGPLRFDFAIPMTKGKYDRRAAIQVWRRDDLLGVFERTVPVRGKKAQLNMGGARF